MMKKHLSFFPSIMDRNDEDLKKLVLDDPKKVGFSDCGDVVTIAEEVFFSSTTNLARRGCPILGLHSCYRAIGNPCLAVLSHAGNRELVPRAYLGIELDATRSSELLISEAMHHSQLQQLFSLPSVR
jgi:hypothetical protein